ncbi:MAG: GNAT family N-acetyltransferase [Chloroflexi bacterium]|nr:GNAT family N-acetyltransferase [Chloroflexota bacterium]
MTDMLVRLYDLPPSTPNPLIRRGITPEKHIVLEWVQAHFSDYWRSECDVAFHRSPVSCFLAVEDGVLLGFGCYDTTRRGFFGPTGVADFSRGRGLGKAILLACLHDMFAQGYGYAIIGGAGPLDFYAHAVGAVVIEDSTPGVYAGMLRK